MEEDWSNDIDTELSDDYPRPEFWRILLMPVRAKTTSAGGIAIPEEAQRNSDHLNYIAKVIALGPLAYKADRLKGIDPPKVGSYIVMARYAGQSLEHRGVKLRLLNDDEILARVNNPEALRVYV